MPYHAKFGAGLSHLAWFLYAKEHEITSYQLTEFDRIQLLSFLDLLSHSAVVLEKMALDEPLTSEESEFVDGDLHLFFSIIDSSTDGDDSHPDA